MNITVIKLINNYSSYEVVIVNSENPGKPRNGGSLAPGESLAVEMWIPWATKASDLPDHSIRVSWGRGRAAYVYQGAQEDGDFVRVSSSRQRLGDRIDGNAQVGGNRRMEIMGRGRIRLVRG